MINIEKSMGYTKSKKIVEDNVEGIRIVSTGMALPKKKISNEDLSRMVETSDEWISTRTGIKNRYQCEEESCVSLAVNAAENALSKRQIAREQIGAVIVATSTPDYIFPSVACLVQKELGLMEDVMAFDLSAACTGFLYGLGVARGLLYGMSKKYVLVIGSEQLSRIVDYTDKTTCILFGDGAGAVILERAENAFYQKSWSRGNVEALHCLGPGNDRAFLSMRGNDVFKFAVTALAQGIDEVLQEAGSTMEEIDYVVCHQANARIIGHVQKKYPGMEKKFFLNIEDFGNTSAASIPIALNELFTTEVLHPGMRILCVGFGAGLTWSSVFIEL